MRIAYLCGAKIPSRAANSVQTLKMCGAFASAGNSVRLYARSPESKGGDLYEEYGLERDFDVVQIAPRGQRGTRLLRFVADVKAHIRSAPKPDLLFSRDIFSLAWLADGATPMIHEAHRSMRGFPGERLAFEYVLSRRSFRKLVVVSEAMEKDYLSLFPRLKRVRIQVEPGAAEPLSEGAALRGSLPGSRVDATQVGYVGHLYRGRGIDVIVEAAKLVPDADFHVIGGTDVDISYWRDVNSAGNVHFHGHHHHARVRALYGAFDILLAPYQHQVFVSGGAETASVMSPLKLFEYMASGAAIVCSDLPVLREVLEGDVTALLVRSDDPIAWAAAIRRLGSSGLRARLASAAKARFIERHTWTARVSRILEGAKLGGPR